MAKVYLDTHSPDSGGDNVNDRLPEYEYKAFLSYSTRSDYSRVREVKRFLERFHMLERPPREDGITNDQVDPIKACVDGVDFKTRPSVIGAGRRDPIWEVIDRYLLKSESLIVLCSPGSTKSAFVSDEIERFYELHPLRENATVLLVVTGGDPLGSPEDVFPRAVVERRLHSSAPWFDIRSKHYGGQPEAGVRDPNEELVRLAETLIGVDKGTLLPTWFREERRLARRRVRTYFNVGSEEIDRGDVLCMVVQERPPRLGRRLLAANSVFPDCGFSDFNAQQSELILDPRHTPGLVVA